MKVFPIGGTDRAATFTRHVLAATVGLMLAGVVQAGATTVYVTYTGTVASGIDTEMVFSSSPTTNLAGAAFTATYVFNVPSGGGTDPNNNIITGYGPTTPSLGATITILGVTHTVVPSGFGQIHREHFGGNSATQSHSTQKQGDPPLYLTDALDLQIASNNPALLSASIVPPLSYTVGPDTTYNTGYFSYGLTEQLTLTSLTLDYSLTDPDVAAAPLPATLPLFGAGLAGLGLFGWRRKRKKARLQV
jgi:hypothetical protein